MSKKLVTNDLKNTKATQGRLPDSFDFNDFRFLIDVINAVADPIFVKNTDFKFVFANDALCKILGMKKEDVLGKTLGESLPKDQMDLFLKNDRLVLKSGEENISEEPLTGKGGKILTIVTKKTRYTDKNGNKFLIGIIRDITEQKKTEEKVRERTGEMEKINKSMISRELKMVELKNEVEALKKQLNKK